MLARYFSVVSAAIFCLNAQAKAQLMSDRGSAKLAARLSGHVLVCGPADENAAKTEEPGFFPLTIRAMGKGGGRTLLSVETKDPKVGFGSGGSEFDPTEFSGSWFIISSGDDGRRHLFVQAFRGEDFEDLECAEDDGERVVGDIAGVVTEIWDAGTISSRGVQCCLK